MQTSLMVQSIAANCRNWDDAVPPPGLASRRTATLVALGKEYSLYFRCGQVYRHLWKTAFAITVSQWHAQWRYLDRVYARVTKAKRPRQVTQRAG